MRKSPYKRHRPYGLLVLTCFLLSTLPARAQVVGQVAEQEGTVRFLDQAYGSMVLSAGQGDQSRAQTNSVQAYKLDTYIERAGGQVDLAKMDIQGSEAVILESAGAALREGHVRSWIVGTHDPDQHRRCLECLSPHYIIRFENQKPSFQPDGIIVAVHKSVE